MVPPNGFSTIKSSRIKQRHRFTWSIAIGFLWAWRKWSRSAPPCFFSKCVSMHSFDAWANISSLRINKTPSPSNDIQLTQENLNVFNGSIWAYSGILLVVTGPTYGWTRASVSRRCSSQCLGWWSPWAGDAGQTLGEGDAFEAAHAWCGVPSPHPLGS